MFCSVALSVVLYHDIKPDGKLQQKRCSVFLVVAQAYWAILLYIMSCYCRWPFPAAACDSGKAVCGAAAEGPGSLEGRQIYRCVFGSQVGPYTCT